MSQGASSEWSTSKVWIKSRAWLKGLRMAFDSFERCLYFICQSLASISFLMPIPHPPSYLNIISRIFPHHSLLLLLLLSQYEYPIDYYLIFMSKKKLSKVIILGDSAVGKTSLLNAYVDQKFLQSYKATVGADFMEKQVIVDGKVINLEIWDTAGQQKFRSLGGAFYRGADCCVLVYDITNKRSFDNIETWITEFLNQGAPKEPEKFPFILIGNKIDRQQEREVEEVAVQEFLAKHPKIKHLTSSAKNRQGVETAFEKIALASVENKQEEIFIPVEVPSSKLRNKTNEKKKGCC